MLFLIVGVIATIAMFVTFGFVGVKVEKTRYGETYYDVERQWKCNKRQFLALLGLIICLFSFVTRIPANTVGVVYSPFGGTKTQTLTEGMHTKMPLDTIYEISTEVQTLTIENVTTQTKDAQYVTSTLDIKYRVDESNAYLVFKQYRKLNAMSNTLIAPTTQRVLELITTKYNVIDILGEKRSDVYSELQMSLTEELAKYGVEFYSISILDMDAGTAIENAIEQEAVAKKAVETAEQNLLRAETEAKQQSVKAQAEQDAAKIKAETKLIEAEAEQKANDMLTQSLTDEVLQKEWIDKWDGKMPTYYAGADGETGIMLNVG
jgi:regulator of protease activity HflC (stomatin/prohibitin superfamily)